MMLHSFAHSGRVNLFPKSLFIQQNSENGVDEEWLEALYDRVVQNEMKVLDDDSDKIKVCVTISLVCYRTFSYV
jgi:hypothetical protein